MTPPHRSSQTPHRCPPENGSQSSGDSLASSAAATTLACLPSTGHPVPPMGHLTAAVPPHTAASTWFTPAGSSPPPPPAVLSSYSFKIVAPQCPPSLLHSTSFLDTVSYCRVSQPVHLHLLKCSSKLFEDSNFCVLFTALSSESRNCA